MIQPIDPCLDEVITLSNRLVEVGNNVNLKVISGLPHGFLSLNNVSKNAQDGVVFISNMIMKIIAGTTALQK